MNFQIELADISFRADWDKYVNTHHDGHLYQLFDWKKIIYDTYNHRSYYFVALKSGTVNIHNCMQIVGILPLYHMKHIIFGNHLTSIPYFDIGGVLADDEHIEKALIHKAYECLRRYNIGTIDLRHADILKCFHTKMSSDTIRSTDPLLSETKITVNCQKVRLLLCLPESSAQLMDTFKSKLRSQIKKPYKSGLKIKIGWMELLDDFYTVFAENMRDLGSPVHSKKLIYNIIQTYRSRTRIFVVYKGKKPVAASVVIGFKDTLENPWASSLRCESRLSPNMMLYFEMLKYACDHGFKTFDFGRSTPGEGTYRFKEQWGAKPFQLYWYSISENGNTKSVHDSDKSKFDTLIHYWQKIPVSLTKIIGPKIRKYINL